VCNTHEVRRKRGRCGENEICVWPLTAGFLQGPKRERGRERGLKRGRKRGLERGGGRPCLYELTLVPAHFKVACGRPKVKSATAFAPNTTAAPRSLQNIARGRDPKVKSLKSFAPENSHCGTTASLVRALPLVRALASRLRVLDQKPKA